MFGYALRALDYLLAPLVLFATLGLIAETYLRRALVSDGDWTLFLIRPVGLLFLTAALVSVAWGMRGILKQRNQDQDQEEAD